jgi:hypothetical protein
VQKFKKHIACFLLLVFTLGVIPAPLLHHAFANHIDAEDNHCHFFHKNIGTHVEEQQNHCDVFKTQTPLYDAVKVFADFKLSLLVISEYQTGEISPFSFAPSLLLPSRAPPIA